MIQNVFSDHKAVQLEISNAKIRVKSLKMWKLTSTFLTNQWGIKSKRKSQEILECGELSKSKNTTN